MKNPKGGWSMAFIGECAICHKSCFRGEYCSECGGALLEDLLARIQQGVMAGTVALPEPLSAEVLRGKFRTAEDFLKALKEQKRVAAKKQLWELNRSAHLRLAAREFEKEFPDPNPAKY